MNKPGRNMGAEAARYAKAMRERSVAVAMKRKEEYLGARVPRELKDKVIKRADELGIPVSLLIRKVLEDTFLGGGRGVENFNLESLKDVKPIHNRDYSDIIGWKTIELNQGQQCDRCHTSMSAGSEAVLGISNNDDKTVIFCLSCKNKIRNG